MPDCLGYSRISTTEQNHDLQLDALKQAGCAKIFTDVASGVVEDRPELNRLFEQLRPGDTVCVYRLDRLGRSVKHLIETIAALEERGVGFKSLSEGIDTTSPGGRLVFHVLAAISQFERDLIRERTKAGLEAARARGRRGGRPTVMSAAKLDVASEMYSSRKHTVAEIAKTLGVSRATIYRSLRASA